MEGSEPDDEFFGHRLVVGEDRGDQGPLALGGEGCGLTRILIGHDRRHRPEGLDLMAGFGCHRLGGAQQDRAHESTLIDIAGNQIDALGITGDDLGILLQLANLFTHAVPDHPG